MKKLVIKRHFNVQPEKVFDAFTNPKDMRAWWTEDTEFDINLQVGGHWKITRKEDDTTFVMEGKYLEIEKPGKLKYTIAMPQFSPNTDTINIEIEQDSKGGTTMVFTQEGTDIDSELQELPEGKISESEKGWSQGFDLMEQYWNLK